MKATTLFLAASLVANVALVGLYVVRAPAAAPAPASTRAKASAASAPASAGDAALRAALASGDTAALQAAGLDPALAREISLGRAFAKIAERARAARAQTGADAPWWRNRANANAAGARELQLVARRELAGALTAAFGDDLGLGSGENSLLTFLSPERREALRRITQDYDEMMAKFSTGGLQLASDKEKLRLLRAERDRDIAALLTPDERLAYEMRTSNSGNTVRYRYGDAIESEAEFQKIFALQKAYDEKFPRDALSGRISPETLRARSEAERQLDADLRATLGDERYAALRRAADQDFRTVDALVSRLNLPSATTNQVLAARDTFAAESQRINSDTSVPFPQRRTQIQELAARAKSNLTRALGGEAADAYAQSSPWMTMLQNGTAYATTPQPGMPGALSLGGPGQSVFPVLPAGANASGAVRQVFIGGGAPTDGPRSTSDGASTTSNVQVMSFGSSTSSDHTIVTAPVTRQVIVTPANPAQPAQPGTPTPPR